MAVFREAVQFVLDNEGGLVDNPYDAGGITNFGISLRFLKSLSEEKLRKYGIFIPPDEDSIRELTPEQVECIYFGEFWEGNRINELRDQKVANYVFDMMINMGNGQAVKILQRACWAATYNMGCLKDDGILGERTVAFVNQIGLEIIPIMMGERAEFYRGLNRPNMLNGWLHRTYRI